MFWVICCKFKQEAIKFNCTPIPSHLHIFPATIHEYCDIMGHKCRPGSSVGIATDYGLDGPGIEFGHPEGKWKSIEGRCGYVSPRTWWREGRDWWEVYDWRRERIGVVDRESVKCDVWRG
jgi:hypothetical protein